MAHRGVVVSIALRVTATEPVNQRISFALHLFPLDFSFQFPKDSSHCRKVSENAKIPIIHPTESWKLAEVIALGLKPKITKTANASAVGGSYSLFTSIDSRIRHCMMHARTIDGEKPATAAKMIRSGTPINAFHTLLRPKAR